MVSKQNQDNNSFDDISIATATINNTLHDDTDTVREYVVKFLFRPSDDKTNTHVAKMHYTILRAMTQIYADSNLKIFDNFGKPIDSFPTLKSYEEYLRHFKLHYVKGNATKNRKPIYLVFHRIHSPVPLSEIRRNEVIADLLRKINTTFQLHHWKEDETNISNLGFHVGVDPTNFLQEFFEERIRNLISQSTKRAKEKIPRFKCCYCSPFLIDEYGCRIATKSYDLQCRQQDAQSLLKLLHQTFAKNPSFLLHRVRHDDPDVYKSAIQKQNYYLSNSRVIPIKGITESQMFYLSSDIEQIPGVTAVLHHKDTPTEGRWNILTNKQHFPQVTNALRTSLTTWLEGYADNAPPDPSFPMPSLAFKSTNLDADSGGSFQTYLSACSSVYSVTDEYYNKPPTSNAPQPQAWGNTSVPIFIESPTTIVLPISTYSPETFEALQQRNIKMEKEIAALNSTVQQLLRERENSTPISPTPSPQSFPQLNDIVAAVVKALETRNSMPHISSQELDQSSAHPPHEHKRKSTNFTNTSLDSSLMDDNDV